MGYTIKTKRLIVVYTIIIVGCLIALSEVIYQLDLSHEKNLILKDLVDTGSFITQQIQQNLNNGIFTTDVLDIFLSASNYDLGKFEEWGENIMRTNPNISAIQLAPDGIVQYIYPLPGNEGAVGHDLLKDQRRNDGALKTIKDKALTIVGPLRLIQNNRMAIIARKPIFKNQSGHDLFWGFTIVLIYIEDLLPKSLLNLENQGVLYQIVGDDPDSKNPPIFSSSETVTNHWDHVLPIKVPNGLWLLKLCSKDAMSNPGFPFRTIGITAALIIGLFFFHQQNKDRERSNKIQNLNSKLTQKTTDLSFEKDKLQKAIEEIKSLKGIVPICSNCKKIRDDKGYWNLLESFIEKHSEASFSHGICPECSDKLYGEQNWYIDMKKNKGK